MKKFSCVFLLALIACLSFLLSCSGDDKPSDFTVSVYTEDGDYLTSMTLKQQTENHIDISSFEKTGYSFNGLSDINGTVCFNANGDQKAGIIIEDKLQLKVLYTPVIYTVFFDPGIGEMSDSDNARLQFTIEDIDSITFPSVSAENKVFNGWCSKDGTRYSEKTVPQMTDAWNKQAASGFPDWEGQKITLYADFSAVLIPVHLEFNHPQFQSETVSIPYGETLDMSGLTYDDGRQMVIGFSDNLNSRTHHASPITQEITLYAVWDDFKAVRLVFDDQKTTTEKIPSVSGTFRLPDFEKAGYHFGGWYDNPAFTGEAVESVPYDLLSDTYYCSCELLTYTASFVADGVTVEERQFTVINPDFMSNPPAVPDKPAFKGMWESVTPTLQDTVISAVYTLVDTFSVSYDVEESRTVNSLKDIILNADLNERTENGITISEAAAHGYKNAEISVSFKYYKVGSVSSETDGASLHCTISSTSLPAYERWQLDTNEQGQKSNSQVIPLENLKESVSLRFEFNNKHWLSAYEITNLTVTVTYTK